MVVYSPMPQKQPTKSLRKLVVIFLIVAVIYAIYRLSIGGGKEAPKAPPVPAVTIQEIEKHDIPLVFNYPARLAGSREVEIRARVGGIILKRAYTEGQFVKRGDLLFEIDPEPYKAALAEAESRLSQTEQDYKRAITLQKQKVLSPREFDSAKAAYGAARAQMETAKINLAYTTVRAPISGYTSEETNSEGSLVVADSTLLTRITQLDPIYIEFAYPDSEAMLMRTGVASGALKLPANKILDVGLIFSDGTSYTKDAAIRFTDSFISTTTGTVRARAIVDNKDQALMPGQFVRAQVKGITQVDAIGVPEKALMQNAKGMFVYTITPEGNAKITPVETGLLNNGVQIIKSGLEPGDKVIVEGMIKVKPDQPVCIDTPETPCTKLKTDAAPTPAAEAAKTTTSTTDTAKPAPAQPAKE